MSSLQPSSARPGTPAAAGYRFPAEWAPHRACWLAWPSHEDLWEEGLPEVQRAFVELCRGIADGDEALEILVPDAEAERACRAALEDAGLKARLHRIPFGDIWMRDIAPLFVVDGKGELAAASFHFNGWGGKYVLEGDDAVSEAVAATRGVRTFRADFVLEGGSVELDGEGTCLTTRQCLLNPNRNPHLDQAALEALLRDWLGVTSFIWLGDGLLNDHTDGHIDTIARFVAPGVVLAMEPSGDDDPNREVLEAILRDLEAATDARGRRLTVRRVPSPGRVEGPDGEILAASYVNFYLANRSVVVPIYDRPQDAEALRVIGDLFPGRRVFGVDAREVLLGGGAFHCITQQEPLP